MKKQVSKNVMEAAFDDVTGTNLDPKEPLHNYRWYQAEAKKEKARIKRAKKKPVVLNEIEKEEIISYILDQLINGVPTSKVKKLAKEKYNLTRYYSEQLFEAAKRRLQEVTDSDREHQITLAIRRYERMYEKAFKAGDIKTAASIQGMIVTLFGLEREKSTNINLNVKPINQLSQAEIEILLANDKDLLRLEDGSE